jgi:hypothetical protein
MERPDLKFAFRVLHERRVGLPLLSSFLPAFLAFA